MKGNIICFILALLVWLVILEPICEPYIRKFLAYMFQ